MPTYEYACTACDHRFEAVQSFSDPNLTGCPVCEGRLRKLFSSVGIVFRGSGFYRTDSRAGAVAGEEAKERASNNGEKPSTSGGKDGGKDGSKGGGKDGSKGGEKGGSKSGGDSSSSSSGNSRSGSSEGSKPKGTAAAAS